MIQAIISWLGSVLTKVLTFLFIGNIFLPLLLFCCWKGRPQQGAEQIQGLISLVGVGLDQRTDVSINFKWKLCLSSSHIQSRQKSEKHQFVSNLNYFNCTSLSLGRRAYFSCWTKNINFEFFLINDNMADPVVKVIVLIWKISLTIVAKK
jgi:hypothetical protein